MPLTTDLYFRDINDAPDAVDDTLSVSENGPAATGDVTPGTPGQDSDLDGDTLTVTQVNGAAYTPGAAITLPSGALLTMNADGTYSYDPNGSFESVPVGATAADTFTYQISDGNGGFDTATVTLTINGSNDAPAAVADTNSGTEQQTLSGNLISGAVTAGGGTGGADTDVDADVLIVTAVSLGSVGSPIVLAHGTLTIQAERQLHLRAERHGQRTRSRPGRHRADHLYDHRRQWRHRAGDAHADAHRRERCAVQHAGHSANQ